MGSLWQKTDLKCIMDVAELQGDRTYILHLTNGCSKFVIGKQKSRCSSCQVAIDILLPVNETIRVPILHY